MVRPVAESARRGDPRPSRGAGSSRRAETARAAWRGGGNAAGIASIQKSHERVEPQGGFDNARLDRPRLGGETSGGVGWRRRDGGGCHPDAEAAATIRSPPLITLARGDGFPPRRAQL